MARYKKYKTALAFAKKVDEYFNSISRTVIASEMVDTGKCDQKGRPIYEKQPIYNDNGDEIKIREYIVPPSISSLCLYLGISRQTWDNYSNTEEFLDTATHARARVEAYLESELNSRVKGIEGIKFNLQNNYGWKEKMQVDGTANSGAVEKYLEQVAAAKNANKDEF